MNWSCDFLRAAVTFVDWKNLLAAFVGTFVGAYVAFKLEQKTRALEQVRMRSTEGNLALLTLFQMFNELRQFQKEVIATVPERPGRWMTMKVTFPQSGSKLGFDASRLAFLLECEDKNLLPEVLLEARRFDLAIEMINRRSHLMLEKIFPALSAAGLRQEEKKVPEGLVTAILGPALSSEADSLTEQIITNVNEDVQSLKGIFDKLRLALVKLLPKQKFIRVDFDQPAP